MTSTLKLHLFFEMVEMFVAASEKRRSRCQSYSWKFDSSSSICAFAMSSQHAYKLVAHLLKNVLKKPIVVETVIVMLKRHKFLKEVDIRHALFRPPKRFAYEEVLAEIQRKTDALWNAIVNHPASKITVRCTWTFRRIEVRKRFDTVRRILSSEYDIKKKFDFVTCKLFKTVDSKILDIYFAI